VTILSTTTGEQDGLPTADQAFRVEQHGIDYIAPSERWATPRDLAGFWGGAMIQVEYFVYGAILMTFGFTFAQALSLILIGNLSYVLLGLCSLQGPNAGTTVFGINRASFGPHGSRLIAFFNWLTQIGFETEGLILIVGAAVVLADKAGFHAGTPAKVVFIVAAITVQVLLPFFGHATMVKVLRLLVLPFVALYAGLLVFAVEHANLHAVHHGAGWQLYMVGLAFSITLSGLGWTENGNDYSRYLPESASKPAIVGWVFVGTAIPQILVMTLGAAVGTFLTTVGTAPNPFQPFAHTSTIASWFVVVFLVLSIVQLFAINSLDLYSSGVTLQAIGIHIKRSYAVLVDSAICLGITSFAVFNSSFNTLLKDFVDVVIVWIAPWMAIFLVDWGLRHFRYAASHLQRTDRTSIYWATGGVNWNAIGAELFGMVASFSALSPTFHVPTWMNAITVHTGGADFSVFTGIAGGALAYVLAELATGRVKHQVAAQERLLAQRA